MSSYKGLIWSLVAIAGTATAATVFYRYATRSTRPDGENESSRSGSGVARQQQNGEGSAWSRSSQIDDDEERDESLSEIDYDYEEDTGEDVQQQHQLMLITREGNMVSKSTAATQSWPVGELTLLDCLHAAAVRLWLDLAHPCGVGIHDPHVDWR